MLVARSELVKLLGTIGVPDASSWPAGKLSVRVNEGTGITKFLESPEQVESLKSSQSDLDVYDRVYAHQFGGGQVEVVDDLEPEVKVNLVNAELPSGDVVLRDISHDEETPLEPTPLQSHPAELVGGEVAPISVEESHRASPVDRGEERVNEAEGDALTERRAELIYKKNRGGLTEAEKVEFEGLQRQSKESITTAFPIQDGTLSSSITVLEATNEQLDRAIEELEDEEAENDFDDEINELFCGTEPELLIPATNPPPKPKRKYVRRKPLKTKKRNKGVYRVANKDMTWEEMVAHYEANPLPVPEKGVACEIVRILKEAGKNDSCVTKAQLVGLLRKMFPKKSENSLIHTVNNHVPTRLRMVYGLYVWKKKVQRGPYAGKWGHFLNGRGRTPQPGVKKRKKYGSD